MNTNRKNNLSDVVINSYVIAAVINQSHDYVLERLTGAYSRRVVVTPVSLTRSVKHYEYSIPAACLACASLRTVEQIKVIDFINSLVKRHDRPSCSRDEDVLAYKEELRRLEVEISKHESALLDLKRRRDELIF